MSISRRASTEAKSPSLSQARPSGEASRPMQQALSLIDAAEGPYTPALISMLPSFDSRNGSAASKQVPKRGVLAPTPVQRTGALRRVNLGQAQRTPGADPVDQMSFESYLSFRGRQPSEAR